MIDRDRRRWIRADFDGDGKITKEEFKNFLHPEEVEHMRSIVIDVSFFVFFSFLKILFKIIKMFIFLDTFLCVELLFFSVSKN